MQQCPSNAQAFALIALLLHCACQPLQGMLVWNPFRKAPGGTQLLLETLVKSSQPLDGNSCPFNATHPLNGCPSGYFCPTAAQQLPCPVGFFCPGGQLTLLQPIVHST
jgi:hypothetical protein